VKLSRRLALMMGATLLAPRGASGDAGGRADAFGRIARARASLRTLKGPFVQIRTIGLLATEVRSHGELTLALPDRLRWDLAPPDEVTFWMGPEGFAYRSAHGRGKLPAASVTLAGTLDDLRVLLGGDLEKLRPRWDLRVSRDDPAGLTGVEVEATPRADAGTPLQSVRFTLAPDLMRPVRVVLVEGPRDRTSIEFGPLAVNAPVDDAVVRPPER
jgi:Outer membrane lipoprotein carrier protein LolA